MSDYKTDKLAFFVFGKDIANKIKDDFLNFN